MNTGHFEPHVVYVISAMDGDLPASPCKVGLTKHLAARLRTLQTGSAYRLEVIAAFRMPNRSYAEAVESAFHSCWAQQRLIGEWFDLDPYEAVWSMSAGITKLFESFGLSSQLTGAGLEWAGVFDNGIRVGLALAEKQAS